MSTSPDYRVALDVYNGPLDLLLFLIRRDEVDIYDIPIAHITGQYLEYVDMMKALDPEAAGEFLVLAATLMEIKSRLLLPKPPIEEDDEDLSDPRLELVRQLLEYKKFKDAARTLEDRAHEQALKHPRMPVMPETEEEEFDLENLDVWNLYEAFNKLLKQTGLAEYKHKIGVDDTPISLHAEDILDSLEHAGGKQKFEDIFGGRDRAEMIGLFLALLELIRQRRVRVAQDRPFASIDIVLLDRTPLDDVPDFDEPVVEEEFSDTDKPFSLHRIEDDEEDHSGDAVDDELAKIEKALDEFEEAPVAPAGEPPENAESSPDKTPAAVAPQDPGAATADTPKLEAPETPDDAAEQTHETTEETNEA